MHTIQTKTDLTFLKAMQFAREELIETINDYRIKLCIFTQVGSWLVESISHNKEESMKMIFLCKTHFYIIKVVEKEEECL